MSQGLKILLTTTVLIAAFTGLMWTSMQDGTAYYKHVDEVMVDPEAWARMGGWYRQDFALYFRPRGHADPFIRTWLDVSGKIQATESEPFAAAVFAGLTDKDAPGKCVKCHSVDRASDGTLAMQWQPAKPRPDTKSATIFSHTTHFSLLHEEGCRTCHKLDRQADYAASYKDQDPQTFASNFSPLRVETCARCHVEQTAGDSCLLCHQYHVGSFETKAVPTEMAKDMK